MDHLADIALEYLLAFMFAGEGNIEPRFASLHMEAFPELLAALTLDERSALSAAATRALMRFNTTDEHGHRPAVSEETLAFLEVLSSGELYEQWRP